MTRSSIDLGDVTHHNITQLKKLNTFVFPVSYNIKFYVDVLDAGELAKLAYYNDIVVGAVCCRIDTSENQRRLYIMTLGCLLPYRRLGIGSVMVNHILNYAEKDGNFDSIFLHVQVNNESAIEFYKKFGFEIVETKEHYYKRIEPADAYVLERNLKPCENGTPSTAESTAVTNPSPNNNNNNSNNDNTNNNNNNSDSDSNTNANINSHSHCNGVAEDNKTSTETEKVIADQNNCNNQQQIHNNHHHNHNHTHDNHNNNTNHSHGKSKA